MRALQGDLVPERQQHAMQSATIVMGGVGNFFVSLVVEQFTDPVVHMRFLFLLAAIAYSITSITLLIVAPEEQYKPPPPDIDSDPGEKSNLCAQVLKVPEGILQ